jgi:hypothetical protein
MSISGSKLRPGILGISRLPTERAELQTGCILLGGVCTAALFWEVRVSDEAEVGMVRTVLTHYIRILDRQNSNRNRRWCWPGK